MKGFCPTARSSDTLQPPAESIQGCRALRCPARDAATSINCSILGSSRFPLICQDLTARRWKARIGVLRGAARILKPRLTFTNRKRGGGGGPPTAGNSRDKDHPKGRRARPDAEALQHAFHPPFPLGFPVGFIPRPRPRQKV